MEWVWDYAVVLDACRFDYFERSWARHLPQGRLSKTISTGSSTVEWRDHTFPGYYDDVVYVSSNPYIASDRLVHGFVGNRHFREVRDVWLHGWDRHRGTVLPETVTDAAREIVASGRNDRMIVHYLQPHAPYLSLDTASRGFPHPNLGSGRPLEGVQDAARPSAAGLALVRVLSAVLRRAGRAGTPAEWKVREWFGMAPASPMDAVRRAYGNAGLRRAYEGNLARVLDQVGALLTGLSGRIIITADHGELLGEGGHYSHHSGSSNPYLLEIPLLVIEKGPPRSRRSLGAIATGDKGESTEEAPPVEDDGAVSERLKALGYVD